MSRAGAKRGNRAGRADRAQLALTRLRRWGSLFLILGAGVLVLSIGFAYDHGGIGDLFLRADPETGVLPDEDRNALRLMVGGVGLCVEGIWKLVRAHQRSRLLSRSRWRTVRISYGRFIGAMGCIRPLLLVDDDDVTHVVGVLDRPLGFGTTNALRDAGHASLAGHLPGFAVLLVDGCDRLIGVRSPRLAHTERSWLRAFARKERRETRRQLLRGEREPTATGTDSR